MKRTRTFIVHLLLVTLQLTLLQWSMQVAAATAVAQARECETAVILPGEPAAASQVVAAGECCPDHMSLDCQYHCSAGAFAFVQASANGHMPAPHRSQQTRVASFVDSPLAADLYRPPRTYIL